jgi:cobalt-precorrin 5A hydrolase
MAERIVYALTPKGAEIARVLATELAADLFLPEDLAEEHSARSFLSLLYAVRENWPLYREQVFVAATGIVVRAISPLLDSKDKDPAVVVMDQSGCFAVSLVSGHLGGANELARLVAEITDGQPVITTATDCQDLHAIDVAARQAGLVIGNTRAIKAVNMAMIRSRPFALEDPEDRLGWRAQPPRNVTLTCVDDIAGKPSDLPGVQVTWRSSPVSPEGADILRLHPKCLVAGMGCNSGTGCSEILNLIKETFDRNRLELKSLACLTTTTRKRDEPGLIQAAAELDVDLVCIEHDLLKAVSVPNPSNTVHKHMGVSSICEAAALIQSKSQALLVEKAKSANATLAVALDRCS